jgi:DNA-binding MarR family transcriptional regulator
MSADERLGPKKTAPKPPPVGIAFLVSQLGAHAANGFAARLAAIDLKVHDAGILRLLGSNPGLTQQALSDLLGMFPSQLVALIDGLESRQLIDRRSNPADRRSYQLHLTKAGRKALQEIGRLTGELEGDLFSALTATEKTLLFQFMTRIVSQQQITPGVHPAYRQIGRP